MFYITWASIVAVLEANEKKCTPLVGSGREARIEYAIDM